MSLIQLWILLANMVFHPDFPNPRLNPPTPANNSTTVFSGFFFGINPSTYHNKQISKQMNDS